MLTNGLVYSAIALSSNMLVVRFNFSKTCAGSYAMYPYLVFAIAIPMIVGYVSIKGNRMYLIYLVGILNIMAFTTWTYMSPCDQCFMSVVPLFMLGLSLGLYIIIQQSCMPFVVSSEMLGTSLGMVAIFQNLGLMLLAVFFGMIHDNTLNYHQGYFWSMLTFLILSIISFFLKI